MTRKHFVKQSKIFLSTLLLLQPVLPLTVLATETESTDEISTEEIISEENVTDTTEALMDDKEGPITSISSNWNGNIFGDVGGQDKINAENFEITENEDGSVKMRSSNNRGKISSSTDGIAYYFQDIPEDTNFEFSVTASVVSFDANNQVSFGMMLRDEIYEDLHGTEYANGNHLSVGALDKTMKVFTRQGTVLEKIELSQMSNMPENGSTYELKMKKMGSLIILEIDDEQIMIEDYTGEIHYAGLFTSRNTEVVYSNISLEIEEEIIPEISDWQFSAFGSNTSSSKNEPPVFHEDGSITMVATGGKISSSDEGISYYFDTLPAEANFEVKAKAIVKQFNQTAGISTPNQKSFGIMLRDEVAEHGDSTTSSSNYIAIGALDTVMKGFYKQADGQTKLDAIDGINMPTTGEEYDLSIKKLGEVYVLNVNGVEETVSMDELFFGNMHAGLFVARDAEVTFQDFSIQVDTRTISSLEVNTDQMKTTYLVNEKLDIEGLNVTAHYSDGTIENVDVSDIIITGFNSSQAGENVITVHYGGKTRQVPITIDALTVVDMNIVYLPARTNYYLGDQFEEDGLVVEATYNNEETAILERELYEFEVEEFFTKAGKQNVVITSTETPEAKISFSIEVHDASLTKLEITQKPETTVYYLGDEIDLDGLVIYAHYSDETKVRLMKGEFTTSELDTTTAGNKTISFMHKGKEVQLELTVKEKEMIGITVTSYPKTTYTVGESFDKEGLVLAKEYDNGDTEELPESEYSLEVPTLDKKGTYAIKIHAKDKSIKPIELQVSVIDPVTLEWKTIRFGQSSNQEKNYVEVQNDGTIKVVALEGGGKITGDHDGISFYYTEIDAKEDNFVLSANIDVKNYAKAPHDGQESFGIMARDAIGNANDSSVFASNIASIGGFSGSTRNPNGIQLFARTGVDTPDGAGSKGIKNIMLEESKPTGMHRLTLKKTNSGYVGSLNNGEEEIIFEPEILQTQDSKLYVGFYTARLATIEVSDIDFEVTKSATDAPKVNPPAIAVEPNVTITSLDKTPLNDYQLRFLANVDGTVTVKKGQEVLKADLEVLAGNEVNIPVEIQKGFTNFSISFLPEDTQFLTSYDKVVKNFTVENRTYQGDIHVSPEGKYGSTGTVEDPLSLDTAVEFVLPGQKIIVHDGVYLRSSHLNIEKYNDGTKEAMKYLIAAEGATPVLDFDRKTEGVILSGDYWHIKGIDFRRSAPNTRGFIVGGSHNVIEQANFYENGDTGLQISRTDQSANIKDWPSHNLILNCNSFDNRDPSDNNADGFAAKLTSGVGNVFRGCMAYNNIDDGWDLYTKAGSGKIGAVLIEDSIAFDNGFVSYDYDGRGDGNGFKLGGEGIHVPHVIRNSMAFGNLADGFTSNSNPGVEAYDNISFNNLGRNLSFTTYPHIPVDFTIDGFVSYQKDYDGKDSYPTHLIANNNYFFDGEKSVNQTGIELSDKNFESLEYIPFERDKEGNIIWGPFLAFIAPELEEPVGPEKPEKPEEPKDPIDPEAPEGEEGPDKGNDLPNEAEGSEKPGETPSEEQKPEEAPSSSDDKNEESSENGMSKEEEKEEKEKKEEHLPDTGIVTSFAKIAGTLLLVGGALALFFSKRKEVEK